MSNTRPNNAMTNTTRTNSTRTNTTRTNSSNLQSECQRVFEQSSYNRLRPRLISTTDADLVRARKEEIADWNRVIKEIIEELEFTKDIQLIITNMDNVFKPVPEFLCMLADKVKNTFNLEEIRAMNLVEFIDSDCEPEEIKCCLEHMWNTFQCDSYTNRKDRFIKLLKSAVSDEIDQQPWWYNDKWYLYCRAVKAFNDTKQTSIPIVDTYLNVHLNEYLNRHWNEQMNSNTNVNNSVINNVATGTPPNTVVNANVNILADCENFMQDIDPYFTDFGKRVRGLCSQIVSGKKIDVKCNFSSNDIVKFYDVDVNNRLTFFANGLKKIKNPSVPLINWRVTYKDSNASGQGIVRDLLSKCIVEIKNELLESIFVGSDVLTVKGLGKEKLDLTDLQVKRKLIAFGFLLGCMICNGFTIPFNLQIALLHMCLHNTSPKTDLSYSVYHILEDPVFRRSISNLMKDADSIESTQLNFSDFDECDAKNVNAKKGVNDCTVKKENFLKYLHLWVNTLYIPPGCKWVAHGFQKYWKDAINSDKYNTFDIYKTLCEPFIDQETIDVFFLKSIKFYRIPTDVQEWLIEIIKESDQEFLRNLLHFWSSMDNVDTRKEQNYQVVLGEYDIKKTEGCLPQSHTCFYQLVLPKNISSKEQLKNILKNAIEIANKQQGAQMRGGKKFKKSKQASLLAKSEKILKKINTKLSQYAKKKANGKLGKHSKQTGCVKKL